MPIYMKDGKSVLFIHIPKAAGTSIDHAFLRQGWHVGFQDGGGKPDSVLRHLRCSPQHFHAALLREMMVLSSFDAIFTVLRDPMDRLQSEYRWRRQHTPHSLPAFDTWVNQVFDRYQVDSFVLDNHIRPQEQFVLPQAQVTALERGVAHTLNKLSETLGVPLPVGHDPIVNASPRDDGLEISAATRARIQTFYAKDFALHKWLMQA